MRFEDEIKLDFNDVLLKPKRSTLVSRKNVILEREFQFYHSPKKWKGIPIFTANMASSGTFEMARTLSEKKLITSFHKYYSIDDYVEFFKTFNNPDYICYTLGIRDKDIDQLKKMIESNLINHFSFICLDVPNGYLEVFLEQIKLVRSLCPKHIIIAGNVVSNEITEEIILAGADIVKVGIGSGAGCTTRRMTGVGYPQLSAIIECGDAAHGIANSNGYGLIISDGGIIDPCDFSKAICAGADFVMAGSIFSGYEQSGGELIEKNGSLFKEYYGSSSNKAMIENYGMKEKHRASEGRYVLMPFKGDINNFLQDIFGSMRSTGTYIGARRLKEFPKRATFIKVNKQLNTSLAKYDVENN